VPPSARKTKDGRQEAVNSLMCNVSLFHGMAHASELVKWGVERVLQKNRCWLRAHSLRATTLMYQRDSFATDHATDRHHGSGLEAWLQAHTGSSARLCSVSSLQLSSCLPLPLGTMNATWTPSRSPRPEEDEHLRTHTPQTTKWRLSSFKLASPPQCTQIWCHQTAGTKRPELQAQSHRG